MGYHFGMGVGAVVAPFGTAKRDFHTHVGYYTHTNVGSKGVVGYCIFALDVGKGSKVCCRSRVPLWCRC